MAAVTLAGCEATGSYPEQCGARLAGWKEPDDGHGVMVLANKVRLESDGSIKWNGERATSEELRRFSSLSSSLNPRPFIILDIETGTSCQAVMRVRRLIDQNAKCEELQICGEGAGPWAQIGDVIGPDGKGVKFYPEPAPSD